MLHVWFVIHTWIEYAPYAHHSYQPVENSRGEKRETEEANNLQSDLLPDRTSRRLPRYIIDYSIPPPVTPKKKDDSSKSTGGPVGTRPLCSPLHCCVGQKAFVVVVFTLNRSFYPTTSAVPPVSFLILHPREIQILWSKTVRQKKTKR